MLEKYDAKNGGTGIVMDVNSGAILGMAICYFFGTLWFITVFNRGSAEPVGVAAALMLCVVPYLLPDAVKLFFAAVLGVRLKPYLKLSPIRFKRKTD